MATTKKKEKPDVYQYREHAAAGVTTVKLSTVTRELLRKVQNDYRMELGPWKPPLDVNEAIYRLVVAKLGRA